jgi:murein DD-endopeptidase MepM/ murein hydrolase activator NlpD
MQAHPITTGDRTEFMRFKTILTFTLTALLTVSILAFSPTAPSRAGSTPTIRRGTATSTPTSTPETIQTPKPTETPPPFTHTVRSGETLISIALRYGVTLEALMEANKLPSADFLRIGQELTIPREPTPTPTPQGRRTHLVRPGETLIAIALRYDVSMDALMETNQLKVTDFLRTGQELVIPDEPTPTPAPTATPTPRGRRTHRVRADETLIAIALRYDVSVDALMEANKLTNSDFIRIGQELIIPDETRPTPAPENPPVTGDENALSFCQANADVFPLDLPADPIRVAISDGRLYLLADGDLFGIDLDVIDEARKRGASQAPPFENLTPPGRKIGRYTIRELVYLTVEPESGDLLLLDKSDDIYRYTPGREGEWRMEFAAAPIPGQYPDPQYLALQSVDRDLYALDSDLSRIWRFPPDAKTPATYMSTGRLLTAVDMVFPPAGAEDGTLIVLTRGGDLLKFIHGRPVLGFGAEAGLGDDGWPAQVFAFGAAAVVVDGQSRRLIGVDLANGHVAWTIGLRFPDMQRLRSAAIREGTLYALAGPTLYVADLNQDNSNKSGEVVCPSVSYDDAYYFDGQDVQALMPDYELPFPGAKLPPRPRSYPGARRLYRYGMHEGVDLYGLDVAGLGIGSPVHAIADGTVIRADVDYVEMTPAEFEAVIARTEKEHRTPPDLTEKLRGQQVHVQHDNGVQSWYAHLSGITPGIVPGHVVEQGDVVGKVGVSGTSSGAYGLRDGAHLHFEIWIDGRYLGQGLSLYETMRLWEAVFEP